MRIITLSQLLLFSFSSFAMLPRAKAHAAITARRMAARRAKTAAQAATAAPQLVRNASTTPNKDDDGKQEKKRRWAERTGAAAGGVAGCTGLAYVISGDTDSALMAFYFTAPPATTALASSYLAGRVHTTWKRWTSNRKSMAQ